MQLKNLNKAQKLVIFRTKLFNKALYASLVFSLLILAVGVLALVMNVLIIAPVLLLIAFVQLGLEVYVLVKINYYEVKNSWLNRYRKNLILLFALTCNLLGLIYFVLTVK